MFCHSIVTEIPTIFIISCPFFVRLLYCCPRIVFGCMNKISWLTMCRLSVTTMNLILFLGQQGQLMPISTIRDVTHIGDDSCLYVYSFDLICETLLGSNLLDLMTSWLFFVIIFFLFNIIQILADSSQCQI